MSQFSPWMVNVRRVVVGAVACAMAACSAVYGIAEDEQRGEPLPPRDGGPAARTDGQASQGGSSPSATGLPCAVSDVLVARCQGCHAASPILGAPNPLVTLADLHAWSTVEPTKKVFERVAARIHDDARPMPPPPGMRLGPAEQALLDDWVARGAPAGSETSCAGAKTDGGAPVDALPCTPDVELAPAAKFDMPASTQDVYVCYGVDVPVGAKKHVTALAPRVDNPTIVHHILLMEVGQTVSSTPFVCGVESTNQGRIVSAWAPGGKNVVLPKEAGFPIAGTAHYMVQVHYSNARALPGQRDGSGYRLCTTSQLRPFDADIAAFGGESFVIPPRATIGMTCGVAVPTGTGTPPVKVFGAMPHMHKLGVSISTTGYRIGAAAPIDLGTQSAWDFANQAWLPLDATILPGDTIVTRCQWKNTTALPVGFGESTNDEMCYSFTMYYPRIPSLSWNAPAAGATCAPL